MDGTSGLDGMGRENYNCAQKPLALFAIFTHAQPQSRLYSGPARETQYEDNLYPSTYFA